MSKWMRLGGSLVDLTSVVLIEVLENPPGGLVFHCEVAKKHVALKVDCGSASDRSALVDHLESWLKMREIEFEEIRNEMFGLVEKSVAGDKE